MFLCLQKRCTDFSPFQAGGGSNGAANTWVHSTTSAYEQTSDWQQQALNNKVHYGLPLQQGSRPTASAEAAALYAEAAKDAIDALTAHYAQDPMSARVVSPNPPVQTQLSMPSRQFPRDSSPPENVQRSEGDMVQQPPAWSRPPKQQQRPDPPSPPKTTCVTAATATLCSLHLCSMLSVSCQRYKWFD